MRILHLPTLVGGMPWGLAQGERALGLLSDVLVLSDNWLQYPFDRVIFKNSPASIIDKIFGLARLIKEVSRVKNSYDVFHFNFGTSLIDLWKIGLPLTDLPLYRSRGKIVVTYNGCDARQKYQTIGRVPFSACHNADCYNGICNSGIRDRMKRKRIAKFDQYADAIFAVNPDLFHFLPERSKFLPYAIANWAEIDTLPYRNVGKRLKIVHSPTNRAAKGSDIIINSLNLIKKRYGDVVEVMLVEGVSNQKARQIYSESDFGIDQVLIGWYGGFAVELMKMGKPVMTFLRKEDLKFLPQKMVSDCQNAIINADPDTIYEKLCLIVENPEALKRHREASLDYVFRWHAPAYVAGITRSVYEDSF